MLNLFTKVDSSEFKSFQRQKKDSSIFSVVFLCNNPFSIRVDAQKETPESSLNMEGRYTCWSNLEIHVFMLDK